MKEPFRCRSCGSENGQLILDLGKQPLANRLVTDISKTEEIFPLRLGICKGCWLLQILDLVNPKDLFSEYLYFSSFSDQLLLEARKNVQRYCSEFALSSSSLVVEIASNDGYLLKNFPPRDIPCLGIEPAANIAAVARNNGLETICEFFDLKLAERLVTEGRKADFDSR